MRTPGSTSPAGEIDEFDLDDLIHHSTIRGRAVKVLRFVRR
jgi:hypothetical protein